jgi:PAS domain S-box-containing protein
MMKKRSIQKKLFISIILLGIGFSAIVVSGVFFYFQNLLVNKEISNIEDVAMVQASELAGNFNQYKLLAKIIGSGVVPVAYFENPNEIMRVQFETAIKQFIVTDPSISTIYLMDRTGLVHMSTDPTFLSKNYSFRDYFKKALSGEAYIDALIGVTSKEFGYYFSYPIRSQDGVVVGVVAVKTNQVYKNSDLFNDSQVVSSKRMLVDEMGVVIASNRPERFLKALGPLTVNELTQIKEGNLFAGQDIEPLQYQAVKALIPNYSGAESVSLYDAEDRSSEVVYLEKILGTPFFLITEIDLDTVYDSVYYLSGLIGLFILSVFFLMAFIGFRLITHFVIRPLRKMTDVSKQIGEGDFSSKLEISSNDEFEDLAETINWMSSKMAHFHEDLLEQVKLKTAELRKKNKEGEEQQKVILNILEDVQKEKETSSSLAEDLVKFKQAADNASDHVVITDADGLVVYGNKAMEKITGYSVQESLGKKAGLLWHKPMTKEFYKKFWETIKDKKQVFRGEMLNRRKNGEFYTAEVTVSPILDENREIKFYLGMERDISERKEAEEQIRKVLNDLEERSQRLAADKAKDEALFANIGDGIVSTNQDGVITMVNDSALNMLGYSREEIVNKPVTGAFELVDEHDSSISLSERPMVLALSTGLKTKTPLGKTYYYLRKDGTKFPANITVTPFVLNGKIVGVVEVFRDVTLEKEIDRMKSEFVSLASHQLRTPLSTIGWYAEMLLSGDAGKLNAEQKTFLDEIYKGNQRMVELVNSLLNVSRIELGTFSVDPEMADVKEIAETVFDELKPQILQKQLEITKSYDPKLGKISLDTKLFRIVLQNLLTNAIKYTPEKAKVGIAIKKRKEDILFSVSDTGYGIPKKDQEKIFTKMFRADNVKAKDTSGTGLGLYIIKSIIEQASGGKVWFESEENKGTTFYFTLPLTGMVKKEGTKAIT